MVTKLSRPTGLICNIFGLKGDGREACLKEYETLVVNLQKDLQLVKLEMESAIGRQVVP